MYVARRPVGTYAPGHAFASAKYSKMNVLASAVVVNDDIDVFVVAPVAHFVTDSNKKRAATTTCTAR